MSLSPEFFTERTVGKEKFSFLVVDQAEKWEAADAFLHSFELQIPTTNKRVIIPCHGISYAQFMSVLIRFPMPTWQGEGEIPPHIKAVRDDISIQRRIAWLELATGKEIPGKTVEAKRDYFNKSNSANLDAFSYFIKRELCNADYRGPFLVNYEELVSRFPQENVVTVDSFEDFLAESNDVTYHFRMNRFGQTHIIEFPLKGLSAERREEIEKAVVDPTPPLIPKRHMVTNKPIPGQTEQNLDDPGYLSAMHRASSRRTILYLNACLPFRIPGETEDQQIEWLGKRLMGDVQQINEFINDKIFGIEGRYNFFFSA